MFTGSGERTIAVSWGDRVCAALASKGLVKVEVDHDWSNRQDPATARGPKPLNPFQEMDYHFYPVMIRWRYADGQRRLAWLPPAIDTGGTRPRLDWQAMEKRFVQLILSDATTASAVGTEAKPE